MVFVTEVIPATFNCFAIPTPPVIFKPPVVGLVDSVSFVKVTTPSTFNFLSISAPPLTISAAFVPVKSVVSVISNLSILTKLVSSALITKFPVVAVILLPSTSMLSTVNLAIVAATPTFKVFVSVWIASISLMFAIAAPVLIFNVSTSAVAISAVPVTVISTT